MACRDAYEASKNEIHQAGAESVPPTHDAAVAAASVTGLFFGVDSDVPATELLQNNLTLFEWAVRNKLYPNFWGRSITGEQALTRGEIDFLHDQGCKIAAIYRTSEPKETEEQGRLEAAKAALATLALGIPYDTVLFLEPDAGEPITQDYLRGYANGIMQEGYMPGFRANTDAKFAFDREFSGGMQSTRDLFAICPIWAVAPNLPEYDRVTTTHLIHPDVWRPFVPSAIDRSEIAVWQYGRDCHPIRSDAGAQVCFHINLIRSADVIAEYMF